MWKIQKIISKGVYNYAFTPEHPNSTKKGYVLEHRAIIENHLKGFWVPPKRINTRSGEGYIGEHRKGVYFVQARQLRANRR